MEELGKCNVCGEPMPEGEEMFMFHGYSGECPKPPLKQKKECICHSTSCDCPIHAKD